MFVCRKDLVFSLRDAKRFGGSRVGASPGHVGQPSKAAGDEQLSFGSDNVALSVRLSHSFSCMDGNFVSGFVLFSPSPCFFIF